MLGEEDEPRSPWECDICGEEMPLGEIERHKQEAHPDYMQLRAETAKVAGRRYMAVILTATVLFVVGFVVLIVLDPEGMGYLIVTLLLLLFAIGVYAVWRLEKDMKPADDALGEMVAECDVCGLKLKNKDWREHTINEHPDAIRTIKIGVVIVAAIAVAITCVVWALLLLYTDWPLGDRMEITFFAGCLAVGVAISIVGIYWSPRQDVKLRKAWREAHPHWNPARQQKR